MKPLGIVLIVCGVLAGASVGSMNMRPEAKNIPQAERLGQAIGGSLCSLTLVVAGFFVARAGDKKASGRGKRFEQDRRKRSKRPTRDRDSDRRDSEREDD